MVEFKVGDKVRRKNDHWLGNHPKGDVGTIAAVLPNEMYKFEGSHHHHAGINLELVQEQRVYIRPNYEYTKTVISEFEDNGGHYIVTKDSDDNFMEVFPEGKLESNGWELEGTVKELTLQEVADLAGVDVSKLRIKE